MSMHSTVPCLARSPFLSVRLPVCVSVSLSVFLCICSCLEHLLDNGADPSVRNVKGYSAVHYAAAHGNKRNLELVSPPRPELHALAVPFPFGVRSVVDRPFGNRGSACERRRRRRFFLVILVAPRR